MTEKRPVGRPRQFDEHVERRLILDAAYTVLRDRGQGFTIAELLSTAGVSTRSFYRHFESKDALLGAMYLRDAEWAAGRLAKRLANAESASQAVTWWIDEIFGFVRTARRAERVSVLGSISGAGTSSMDDGIGARAHAMLVESLRGAIDAGVDDGSFVVDDPAVASDLVAAAVVHAAGLLAPQRGRARQDQASTTGFCLRALGAPPTA